MEQGPAVSVASVAARVGYQQPSVAPPWVAAHRLAPPNAQSNPLFHALPYPLNRSSVVGLALFLSARTPSAVAVVAAIAGRKVSSPQSGVAAIVQRPCHG